MKERPTIAELEAILRSDERPSIEIQPDGSIIAVDGEPNNTPPKILSLSKILRAGGNY